MVIFINNEYITSNNKNTFKFSIIMTVFDTEKYVRRAINSVINQTLNFTENIQLILVDDGSTDDSLSLLKYYEKKYPNNIIIIHQDNFGQSSARNLGLKYVEGKYVNFLDSDDFIPHHALKFIYNFFEKNFEKTDVVVIPMSRFERSTDKDILNFKFNENRVIDLIKEPENIQFSVSSAFIKSETAKSHSFEESLHIFEDILYINKILLNKKTLGIFKDATYYYRLRNDLSDINSRRYFDKEYLSQINILSDLLIKNIENEEIPLFIQNTLLYLYKKELENKTFISIQTDEERNIFENNLLNLIKCIDTPIIKSSDFLNENLKYYTLFIQNNQKITVEKNNQDTIFKIDNNILNTHITYNLHLNQIKVVNKLLILNVKLIFFKSMNLNVYLNIPEKNKKYEGILINEKFRTNSIFKSIFYEFKIPLSSIPYDSEIHFTVKLNNEIKWTPTLYLNKYLINENSRIFESEKFNIVHNNKNLIIKRKFLISVVMPIYNVENYLKTAIESLINQTIDFEKNIQLIIVDDESPDNSKDIALTYQKKYPENIMVLSKKNGGQASAFNLGLKYVQGRYVNFLDSDDYIAENAFELAYDFMKKNYNKIDVVAMPLHLFERRTGPHFLNYKFNKTRIIDLVKEPNNPHLSVSSSLIKYEKIKNMKFDTELPHGYDGVVMNKILFEKKKYGVVKEAKYFYRQRMNNTSMIDNIDEKHDSFTTMLTNYCIELISYSLLREKKVLPFIQCVVVYNLQWILRQPHIRFENKIKKDEFYYYLYHVLGYINVNYFLKNRNVDSKLNSLFVYLRNRKEYEIKLENNELVMKSKNQIMDKINWHALWIDNVELKNNNLNIYGLFSSFFSTDSFKIKVNQKNNGKTISFTCNNLHYTPTHRKNMTFLSMEWLYKYNFDVSIPIENVEYSEFDISIEYEENGIKHNLNPKIRFAALSSMSLYGNSLVNNNKIIIFKNNKFILTKYNFLKYSKIEFAIIKKIFEDKPEGYLMAIYIRFLHLFLYPFFKNKKIWLYADRPSFADDNAFHLFKYSNKQKDGIKKYFVIDKKSPDYKKLKKEYGNIVAFGSLKHKLLYVFAEKNIFAFTKEPYWNPFHSNLKLYAGLSSFKRYFLQHGVAVGNFKDMVNKYSNKLSFLNTSSDLEKKSYLEEGYNFDEGTVQTFGLPRYDNLINDSKKQIVYMPTWRIDIKNSEQLINSEYYKKIHSFLNNPKLHNILEKYGYNMVFRPHPETMEFIDYFKIDEKIRISVDVTKESYQQLFKESNLLITDYSSVFFDFAYLKKPVIYYQYAFEYNYEKGYFDIETMGFGPIVDNEEDLLNLLEKYLEKNCEMKLEYKERVDGFFKYHDRKNSERVYKWILNH